MVSTRSGKHKTLSRRYRSDPRILRTLIGVLHSQTLKPPLLKSLYRLLLDLSLSNDGVSSQSFNGKFQKSGFKIESKDLCDISNILFKEINERFKQLFTALHDVSESHASEHLHSEISEADEIFTLVLRCCMVILNLLVFDQNFLFKKCESLFSILRVCSSSLPEKLEQNSLSFVKSASRDFTHVDNGCTTSIAEDFVASISFIESSKSRLPFLSAILEVFADELLAHKPVREYFFLVNSISCPSEMLFINHPSQSVMGSVIEVIAANFLTSFSNDEAFEDFLNRSFSQHNTDRMILELSFSSGLSLLLNPIMLSAPKILLAHVISLICEAIGVNHNNPDHRLMDLYLSAFEKSITLYTKNMSSLQMNDSSTESCSYGRSFHPSFESYIQPITRNKINRSITKFESSWNLCLSKMLVTTKAELVSASIDFIKENEELFNELGNSKILSMLEVIILKAVGENNQLDTKEATSPQDLCLTAAVMKLMSNSLLQILRVIGAKSYEDLSSCREYATTVSIISSCFKNFNVHIPIQTLLVDIMENYPLKHKESKLMLFHFAGLLSLSSGSGLEFLIKECIYMIMISLKLFILEEGDVNALMSLLGPESFQENDEQAQMKQKSSKKVASNFLKIQTMYLSPDLLSNDRRTNQVGPVEESSSGKIFLKCRLEIDGEKEPSDFDDLAEFIECKSGKNYSSWLKDRKKYREFKSEKVAVLSWKKRRKTWRQMSEKNSKIL